MTTPVSRPTTLPRPYRTTRLRRVEDILVRPLVRRGLVRDTYLLETRGRRTGQLRVHPVTLVENGAARWLVAPYGPVGWVLNARAAGEVTLRRGKQVQRCTVHELNPVEAGPILKVYANKARPTRAYFWAGLDAPIEDFVAEAHLHPVFELRPVS